MADWWKLAGNPDWPRERRRVLSLLESQSPPQGRARIVGRDALPAQQQLTAICAAS